MVVDQEKTQEDPIGLALDYIKRNNT
jgi:hypothetical protein